MNIIHCIDESKIIIKTLLNHLLFLPMNKCKSKTLKFLLTKDALSGPTSVSQGISPRMRSIIGHTRTCRVHR